MSEKQDLIEDMKKGIKENPTTKKYLDKMIADGIDEDTALNIIQMFFIVLIKVFTFFSFKIISFFV